MPVILTVLFLSLIVLLYSLFAMVLQLPSFKASAAVRPKKKRKKTTLSNVLSSLEKRIAKHIPVSTLKRAELEKELQAAEIQATPQEYIATAIVLPTLILLLSVPVLFVNRILVLIPAAFAVYMFYLRYTQASRKSDRRKLEIEKELPRFVSYMANSLRSSRNLIALIETYKGNYNSALTEELAKTVADMRTGNQERALQHLDSRINSELLSELVRGLLSSLRGDDMATYFDNLGYKLSTVWQQRLREQALKKEPKVTRMSYLLFGCALVSVFVILGVMLKSSLSIFGG